MAYVKITPEMVEQAIRETDWKRFDAITDEEIAAAIASDPDAAPLMSAADMATGIIRLVLHNLGITQAEFSARYLIPIETLQDWEHDRQQPDPAAFAYLRVIGREPEMVAQALKWPQPQHAPLTPA